ncbi:hypothetical protein MSG28_014139 [Choristoneura fumiferana]|uniref:Uncharacterized protein n=1 Tax=Choristoneura fumiferana TaxID=7141 RepID=A0ACC0JFZ0_CHOFU|nr:hypothetical protein MSG28_014139 [Choristoneura fumiferana]
MARAACIVLLFIAVIRADPTCVTHHETDVVCTAGPTDHILVRGLVSENKKTTGITLRDCRITDVELEAFHHLPALEYIDLSSNKIRRLKLGVLDGFKKLQALNLSYNMLSKFPLGLFDQKPKLRMLDLKGNRFEEFELGVFDPLKKLKHVDLSSNAILGKNLNPYIFGQSRQIQSIDFSRNDMSNTPDLMLAAFENLDFLNLDRCSLNQVPRFATRLNLQTMKHLILSTNKITSLSNPKIFRHLIKLENLNFVANSIEKIHGDIFKPLKNIQLIFLNKNKIKVIPESLFRNLQHLNNVDLSKNRIESVPVNAFRGTNLKILNLSGNRFTYLQDNFYLELWNSGVRLSQFFFDDNPWQCSCLNDVLVEVKKYGILYRGDKYRGQRPVCVTNEFNCKRQSASNDYYSQMYDNTIL